ncbi:hypothetical protein [Streptomyces kaniharaensis]|uniref:hypothetical protein n=1 Tax=Streptomyces kaniharaensis TaxID=212423 RepID=UPI001294C4CD|nr:hypothetical protein [Streptomyces kaniharaensis]
MTQLPVEDLVYEVADATVLTGRHIQWVPACARAAWGRSNALKSSRPGPPLGLGA